MSQEPAKRPLLVTILDYSQNVVYYGMAIALLVTIGVLFISVGTSLLEVFEVSPLQTALAVLDRVLLISIFVELLVTIAILVQEREIFAEPFLLIGVIAVVRRILLVTAEAGQTADAERFLNLVTELGVLTVLVISLAAALYFTRRAEPRQEVER